MPKRTEYTVSWSAIKQSYHITANYSPFPPGDLSGITIGTASWFDWLSGVDSFHFRSANGETFTVRKETRKRGTAYWVGYRKVQGKLRKQYLGTDKALTIRMLEQGARKLASLDKAQAKQHSRAPLFVFNHTLPSALRIFGFSSLPTALELKKRYRQLAKIHYPDFGGNHADMVAINLAHAYLAKAWFK